MKYLRLGVKIGIILFFVIIFVNVIIITIFPPLLISLEFSQDLHIYVLVISIYVGYSFLIGYIITPLPPFPDSKRKLGDVEKKVITIITTGLFFIVAPCLGWFTYTGIMSMSAYSLHQNAPKENIQFDVIATSGDTARRELRRDCQIHVSFYKPKISSAIQYACADWKQWERFNNGQKNVKVTLYGKKSYYGYELHCCK